jgi:hypothetical protein
MKFSHNQEICMSEMLSINTPDGAFSAYVAQPASGPAPVIVVLQEIFGVNADMRQSADELAEKGFIAYFGVRSQTFSYLTRLTGSQR